MQGRIFFIFVLPIFFNLNFFGEIVIPSGIETIETQNFVIHVLYFNIQDRYINRNEKE